MHTRTPDTMPWTPEAARLTELCAAQPLSAGAEQRKSHVGDYPTVSKVNPEKPGC